MSVGTLSVKPTCLRHLLQSRRSLASYWSSHTSTRLFSVMESKSDTKGKRPNSNGVVPPTKNVASVGSIRVSTLFYSLVAVGGLITAYGIYDFYSSLPQWPQVIRSDLRAGLKAKLQGDFVLSIRFLTRAWRNALTFPLETFAPENPRLNTSGIAITLGAALEDAGRAEEAYAVYGEALEHVLGKPVPWPSGSAPSASVSPRPPSSNSGDTKVAQTSKENLTLPISPHERLRAVALALKLGQMAEEYDRPAEEEERWLACAVAEALRVVREPVNDSPITKVERSRPSNEDGQGLKLPEWVKAVDVGSAMQALGAFYARIGRAEYTIPLYLQALSILIPDPSASLSHPSSWRQRLGLGPTNADSARVQDRCRAAQLLTALPDAILSLPGGPTPERLAQAERWARAAVGVAEGAAVNPAAVVSGPSPTAARTSGAWDGNCKEERVAALYGVGAVREMCADPAAARAFFDLSLTAAREARMQEGVLMAKAALSRLKPDVGSKP